MAILVIAEHDNQQLKAATLNALAAAQKIGGDVHVLVAGNQAAGVAQAAAKAQGVSKVLLADGPALAEGLAENVAAQVLAIASNYSHILFPATASGKNIAPRVAAKLDVAQLSDICPWSRLIPSPVLFMPVMLWRPFSPAMPSK